ncbi:MAG: bifunctional diaminohydroxyphosphoribosylaminopyrimidine deaminase/5-amino-6-(5-phosphoribosylamino)uracil reductase RibD, partial [Candidatus Dadabacteria bacterium]|nr:bifunctional diaminohydroxyphosphoribosylaminopyrimidine deaminase/5-amino-6-(5-phosphoribosylamino)uracil reductase RibD [Candidatus Dadabacteria bacterium]NIQ13485.1 bifunctional diaminohydroxyphosphoribosylaminopyrimidine deaminase/5-amino-6-(5-phosphoribosylamino)uracil reductase RibD [Candidatus Dadabacteria bacterium]
MASLKDIEFMKKALKLAKLGEGNTSPNPMVGAVVVKKGEIIGRGYHRKAGLPHAEIEAFNDAVNKGHILKGSTLYVTLEPCCHLDKRTPPCTEAIMHEGIRKVFVGTLDPNPKVSGNGVDYLKGKGIKVESGILEEDCRNINEFFNSYIVNKIPFVVLKMASTIDGKIASKTGDSKWIGSPEQRKIAHELRSKVDGVLVGINTVLKDDPQLNVRISKKNITQPVPIVLDSKLRIPLNSNIFKIHDKSIIVTTSENRSKVRKLENVGAVVLKVRSNKEGMISIKDLLRRLGKMEFSSILIEGGSQVGASFLKQKLVDKVNFFISPRIIGGDGISMIGDLNKVSIKDSIEIKNPNIKKF